MNKFEGLVIIPTDQLYDLMCTAVEYALEKQQATGISDSKEITAKEAAGILQYKSTRTLSKYHYKELNPIRRGRNLFYNRKEVMKLKEILFNHE